MASGPTIIEQPSIAVVEATRAKLWRKSVMKLSRRELAVLAGYSEQAIQLFERGYDYRGQPLKARAWKRYRLVCAGLGVPQFDWRDPGASAGQP